MFIKKKKLKTHFKKYIQPQKQKQKTLNITEKIVAV
jgi:hypothetical protein